jgi:hypothetical protein
VKRSGTPGLKLLVEVLRGELEVTAKALIIAVDRSSITG